MQDGFACFCAVQDWSTDVWSRGAPIGVFPPGALTSSRSCLAHSIGPVHWAGTETSAESQGYMNGALLAGMRAARHVASSLTGLVDQYYSQSTHPVSGDDVVTYSDAVLAPMVALAAAAVRFAWWRRNTDGVCCWRGSGGGACVVLRCVSLANGRKVLHTGENKGVPAWVVLFPTMNR